MLISYGPLFLCDFLDIIAYVTEFAKTDLMDTNTEIHFLPVDKSHSCTIQRHQALVNRWPGLLFQAAFFQYCKATRAHFIAFVAPEMNKTAWDAKLILTADLAYPVSCASLGHLLMAQHCHLCLNICFSLSTAPHPPTPYRLNP